MKISKEKVDEIYALSDAGYSTTEIVKKTGLSQGTVYKYLKMRNLTRPVQEHESEKVQEPPQPTWLEAFQPLYQRERELLAQRATIDQELRNIKATLQNAINMMEKGN